MTKEQKIYKNMKKRGRIFKAYGKWMIKSSSLYLAIKEAGYKDDKTIYMIMRRMMEKGYIRQAKDIWGRTSESQGLGVMLTNYIILKWEN